jgi:hypothetical protein
MHRERLNAPRNAHCERRYRAFFRSPDEFTSRADPRQRCSRPKALLPSIYAFLTNRQLPFNDQIARVSAIGKKRLLMVNPVNPVFKCEAIAK